MELDNAGETGKAILSKIGGISPSVATELVEKENRREFLDDVIAEIDSGTFVPRVYEDDKGVPREFHVMALTEFEEACTCKTFDSLSHALTYYFENKTQSNRARQKSHDLVKSVQASLDKVLLKKQRLSEDLLNAENSEDLRLYGELLTANMCTLIW